ncbi:hypothetical protein [Streptomyces sp. NBC_01006]|uniref:hypothetical protein n=1 Tax=Streptomyces sp. NBC_01006 TaxID=2903716 RepID=UPI00386E2E6F|nr:hypothetical protein OG509_32195 [Streptomyces sp. NBC_01006]
MYTTLLRYTPYIADLTSPQVHEKSQPPPDPDVRIDLTTSPATATARSPQAREVLIRYGWTATAGPAGGTYALPKETSESDTVAITVMTKHNLHAVGAGLTIALGIPATTSPRPATVEPVPIPVQARATGPHTR